MTTTNRRNIKYKIVPIILTYVWQKTPTERLNSPPGSDIKPKSQNYYSRFLLSLFCF
jgi:hypothetical protein